jgi:transcriptional regulator with XRE-family HTH domain
MNYISLNIKYLFDSQDLSEENYGKLFDLNRGAIQSYTTGKASPKIEALQKIAVKYNLLIDDLVNRDISKIINTESELHSYPVKEVANPSNESITLYSCPECIVKQKDIESLEKDKRYLEKENALLTELLENYRENAKKETEPPDSTQERQGTKL